MTIEELDEQIRTQYRLPLDAPELREKGNELALRKAQQRQIEAARQLYHKLIQPLEPFLEGADRILLCPDGPLHYLPFEALICGERAASNGSLFHRYVFWGERQTISYIPSATVLKNIRDELTRRDSTAANDFIGFGDPDFEARPAGEDDAPSNGVPDEGRQVRMQLTREYAHRRGLRVRRIPATGTEVRKVFALFRGDELEEERPSGRTKTNSTRDILAVPASGEPAADDDGPSILVAERARGYLRDQASERRAINETGDCRYVHFATHGLLDDENPLYSGIAFSPTAVARDGEGDWLLQTFEIFSLKLNADLVTLSACQTGLGKLTKGEGLVGMTRAFLYAGTPSVVVSLWNVADEATSVFMVDFYSRILAGKDKATALTEAKRKMMNDLDHPEYRDPFFWAAFVLQGEWTNTE